MKCRPAPVASHRHHKALFTRLTKLPGQGLGFREEQLSPSKTLKCSTIQTIQAIQAIQAIDRTRPCGENVEMQGFTEILRIPLDHTGPRLVTSHVRKIRPCRHVQFLHLQNVQIRLFHGAWCEMVDATLYVNGGVKIGLHHWPSQTIPKFASSVFPRGKSMAHRLSHHITVTT